MRLRRQRRRRIAPDEIFLTHKFIRKIIMKIKKGDTVIVTTGKDRGKEGKVLRAFPKKSEVLVEGVHIVQRHKKSTKRGSQGQIVSKPMPFPAANVSLKDSKKGKPTRVGYTTDDKGKKVRVMRKSGEKVSISRLLVGDETGIV